MSFTKIAIVAGCKAFCNNIIEEINISMKYRLDIAWSIRDIKRFLKAHRV